LTARKSGFQKKKKRLTLRWKEGKTDRVRGKKDIKNNPINQRGGDRGPRELCVSKMYQRAWQESWGRTAFFLGRPKFEKKVMACQRKLNSRGG